MEKVLNLQGVMAVKYDIQCFQQWFERSPDFHILLLEVTNVERKVAVAHLGVFDKIELFDECLYEIITSYYHKEPLAIAVPGKQWAKTTATATCEIEVFGRDYLSILIEKDGEVYDYRAFFVRSNPKIQMNALTIFNF